MFHTKVVQESRNTHFTFSNIFSLKSSRLCDDVKKDGTQATTYGNTAHNYKIITLSNYGKNTHKFAV